MVAGRWALLVSMVLIGPLLWWAGVSDTAGAAYATVAPGDSSERYFISNYESPGRSIAVIFAFFNLVLLAVLFPTARQLRTMRTGTFVRACVTALLALSLALVEHWLNPVTTNWGGDPDAWSMVDDHMAPWYDGVSFIWFALTVTTATVVAVLAFLSALSVIGERHR